MNATTLPQKISFKTLTILLLLICSVFIFGGCGRATCTCPNATCLAFYGFTKTDMDSVFVKAFAPGTNFTNAVDSFIAVPQPNTDSVPFIVYLADKPLTDTGTYDYIITVPADTLTFKVNQIKYMSVTCSNLRCKEDHSTSGYNLTGYNVNGVENTLPLIWGEQDWWQIRINK